MEIEKLRELTNNNSNNLAPIVEFKTEISQPQANEIVNSNTDKLVDNVFQQAVVNQVQNDNELQSKMLGTAKKFTETKMEVIKNKVDKEDKQAFFETNKSACGCFGYDEKDTEKWAVKYMKTWHCIMTAIWITIGWVTYAPITFIAKKIGVIFKNTWIAIFISIILYFTITLSPLWINWLSLKII